MITLNTRKLSEMMEASGAAIIHAHEAVRKDVDAGKVDPIHQAELRAVREVDDMFIHVFLINKRETMQAAVEYLVRDLTDAPDHEDTEAVYVHLKKVQAIKAILQMGM